MRGRPNDDSRQSKHGLGWEAEARLYNIVRGSNLNKNVRSRGAKCQRSGEDASDEAITEHNPLFSP